MAKFNFCGNLVFPKADSKRPFIKKSTSSNKNEMYILNVGVKAADNNIAYVEMMGVKQDKILSKDTDNNNIEVKWADRFDEDVLNTIPSYKKISVNLSDDNSNKKSFLSEYDAIEYIKDNIDSVKDKKFCITGNVSYEPYKGKWYTKFRIQNVYVVADDRKNRLGITMEYFWNKDCIDKSDWNDEKIMYLDGYVQQYINKDEGVKYVPQRLIFNASKLDPNNEKHQKLLDYKLKYIETKKNTYQKLMMECLYFNGSTEIDFDESQLTKAQKEQIELGLKELKDFMPKGNIYGAKVVEYRIYDFSLKGDYADGVVDTELKPSEFEEEIYEMAETESLDEVLQKAEEKSESTNDNTNEIDDEDLFG